MTTKGWSKNANFAGAHADHTNSVAAGPPPESAALADVATASRRPLPPARHAFGRPISVLFSGVPRRLKTAVADRPLRNDQDTSFDMPGARAPPMASVRPYKA